MCAELNQASIAELSAKALKELEAVSGPEGLEIWRVCYLGRKGQLSLMLRELSTLPADQRQPVGAAANEAKRVLEGRFAETEASLKAAASAQATVTGLDITLPGRPARLGALHPTTQALRQICGAFASLGFQVYEGPEVEWDYYNFEALNIPPDHPARDMWATFWIDYKNERGEQPMLLRTHTSPMQVRVMNQLKPPVRVIVPGKCYRFEATDATHESMFYQVEGFAVDENITMADLKGTLFEVAKRIFGQDRKVRFRCDYFPFVEPGVEVAIDCIACKGTGCRLCGDTGWIEILGAGMIHPEVLRRVNYDPERYSGFAFGLGVERTPMLKYGIDDIRHFYSNDLRFLRQFPG